ncbi:hypothetical protein [Neisseria sicca]|uniref:hypothetical protein n=1 Tax=Neisseria sicca TaxID=490 RepID=UPI001F4CFE89|nr:hypothetical protein [Neisseria sicca]
MASSQDLRLIPRYKAYIHDKQQDETHRLGRLKSNFAFQTTLYRKLILQIQCCLPHNSFSYRYAFYTSFS